jgi:hypothetical protein
MALFAMQLNDYLNCYSRTIWLTVKTNLFLRWISQKKEFEQNRMVFAQLVVAGNDGAMQTS